jgi:hypothetical protein
MVTERELAHPEIKKRTAKLEASCVNVLKCLVTMVLQIGAKGIEGDGMKSGTDQAYRHKSIGFECP